MELAALPGLGHGFDRIEECSTATPPARRVTALTTGPDAAHSIELGVGLITECRKCGDGPFHVELDDFPVHEQRTGIAFI